MTTLYDVTIEILNHAVPDARGRLIRRFMEDGRLTYGSLYRDGGDTRCLIGSLLEDDLSNVRRYQDTMMFDWESYVPGLVDCHLIIGNPSRAFDTYAKVYGLEAARSAVNRAIRAWMIDQTPVTSDIHEAVTA